VKNILWTLPGWAFGLVFVLFPVQVVRFYQWFHGPQARAVQQLEPRHARNAGLVWLVITAVVMYTEWRP
jgi:hypothetical protein